MTPRPGRRPAWLTAALVVLLATPFVELALVFAAGRVIGPWWTLGLLVLTALVGAVLIRREGGRALAALREAGRTRQMPAVELADSALVLLGGVLLLLPGFVTDVAGLVLVLPVTRPPARRALQALVERGLLRRAGVVRGETSP